MGIKTVRIAHLYPKEMNLYGDSGNVLCLQHRLKARGYDTAVLEIGIGDVIPDFDILFIGGGQDREMKLVAYDLRKKAEMLRYAVHCGKTVLAICGGYQLLGDYYKTYSGDTLRLSGALPFYTEGSKNRMVGNTVTDTPFGKIVGFENHSGRTFLGGIPPLGTVITGYGNNGIDKTEGLLFQNTFGTYAHGPVLPKNPALADELLRRALGCELPALEDGIENLCHNRLVRRFS